MPPQLSATRRSAPAPQPNFFSLGGIGTPATEARAPAQQNVLSMPQPNQMFRLGMVETLTGGLNNIGFRMMQDTPPPTNGNVLRMPDEVGFPTRTLNNIGQWLQQ